MPEMTSYHPGSFCWIELSTSDGTSARTFYTRLFGWTTKEIPLGDGTVYVMLQKDGKDVGALYETNHAPPNWLSYVSVANVDQSLAKAQELGAKVLGGPMDVFDAGRMVVVADPEGAALALWQAGRTFGAEIAREPNTLCWNELATKDDEAARAFYSALFGWRMDQQNFGEPYTIIHNGDETIGGLYKLADYGADMPSNWMPYFAVTNADATAEQVKSLGGSVVVEAKDIPTVGRIILFADPQGAMFWVLQPA
jgi:predicted enzyme related to lactoylglutathione lyase